MPVRLSGSRAVIVMATATALMCAWALPAAAKPTTTVNVKLHDSGCPKKITTKAGATTFKVTNVDASSISEFEVQKGGRILGERENLAPGLSGEFSLTLKPGTYTTNCPGGDRQNGKLVVTGNASTKLTPAGNAAVAQYRTYIEAQTKLLVSTTTTFVAAVKSGNLVAAKTAYAPARAPYESIEPVAETFGDLDPRIDARANDVPAKQFGGFHKIEQALYQKGNLTGMGPVADALMKNVEQLANLVKDVQLEPATIANGAVELLNEVSSSKITGEEERYSHIDLVDFLANVQGSQAAFASVRPILAAKDPSLAAQIDARFADVLAALKPYGSGTQFVSYTALTTADTQKLSQAIDALAEPLSKVAAQIVGK